MIIVVDAGHGAADVGGKSLGTPEKNLALFYALDLGRELQILGHMVVYTRVGDTYPSLADRAKMANDANADLFVSVHANANDNEAARGPWTLHADGSKRGREYAAAAQRAMAAVMAGSNAAVYPDGSGWTGGRTLHVLRQTRCPAILLELGFMTNRGDISLMEDAKIRRELCRRVAGSLHVEGGGLAPMRPKEPEVVIPFPPAPDHTGSLKLDRIEVPVPAHIDEVARVRGLTPDQIRAGLVVLETVGRGYLQGGAKGGAKALIDAAADWLKRERAA